MSAYYFLKTSKPSPLLPWNLFCKCSPEKSTGVKFIKLPNKSQAPQQGRNLPSYQCLTGAEPGTSEEHGRVGSSRAKHESIPAGSWGVLCASPGAAWDHRGMTRRRGCDRKKGELHEDKGGSGGRRTPVPAAPVPER